MIPILFEAGTADFSTNGIGRLSDCVSCEVTEERNGIFEIEFIYPITGAHYDDIDVGKIIITTHDEQGDKQPFVIYRRSAPINGQVVFNAHHVSYGLSNVIIKPFSATNISVALAGLKTNALTANPFTFWTDKYSSGTFSVDVPKSCRTILAGQAGSILDSFGGGEYEWDNYNVKLYAHRGSDKGVTIRYGKNLIDLNADTDIMSLYDSVIPYWTNGETVIYGAKVTGTGQSGTKTVTMDLSGYFEETPTATQLQARASSIINANTPWVPKVNIKVDFVALWQTEEYKNIASLERVRLCDTVTVQYPALGVDVKAKVVKAVWNPLLDRYDSIEIGDARQTYADAILADTNQAIAELPNKSFMANAIDYATEQITGGLGGYIVINRDANGNPIELLIMDTPNKETAVNVWRWNSGGLGHSHSGYDGPYDDVAITQDGQINAAMITIGKMVADMIEGGTLKLGGESDVYGQCEVYDENNNLAAVITHRGFVAYYTGAEDYLKPVYARLNSGALEFYVDGIATQAGVPVAKLKINYLVDSSTQQLTYGNLGLYAGREFDVYADNVYFYKSGSGRYVAITKDAEISIHKADYNYTAGEDVPASSIVIPVIRLTDNNFNDAFRYRITRDSTDTINHQFYVGRALASGLVYETVQILLSAAGNVSVSFDHPEAWRSAINAVNKAGDTMTGNLNAKFSGFDLSKTDNGVSATVYPSTFSMLDAGSRIATRLEGLIMQSGNVRSYWYTRNYDTAGNMVAQKGIWMQMDKSGNLTWNVSDYANFRTAIGAAPADTGAVTLSNYNSSIVSGTNTTNGQRRHNIAVITVCFQLAAGTYANTAVLFKVSPVPAAYTRASLNIAGKSTDISLYGSGECHFNNTTTLSSAAYVLGQIIYAY